METNKIICGDVLQELKKLPSESIDFCMTSPPYYGLRNYGVPGQIGLEETFAEFMDKMIEIMKEIKRVMKPTGQIWINFGDCYGGLGERGCGGKNNHCAKRLTYFGGNIEKSTLTNPYRQQNAGRSGNQKCMLMMPERFAIRCLDELGLILRNKIKWAKQIYHYKQGKTYGSVMPTSVKDRFNESGEELYFFVKSKKYYSNLDAVRLKNQTFENRADGIDRQKEYEESKYNKFNYRVRDSVRKEGQPQFKASEEEKKSYEERNTVIMPGKKSRQYGGGAKDSILVSNRPPDYFGNKNGKNLPTIWLIGSEPHNFSRECNVSTDHFATYPHSLCEIPIKFGCPPNGIVLDPFAGSGTTCIVAKKLGRQYLGIELNEKYCEIANKRLNTVTNPLFCG